MSSAGKCGLFTHWQVLGLQISVYKVENRPTGAIHVSPRHLIRSRSPLLISLPNSGRSCISPDGKFIVVSNMYDGVDFYSISTHVFSHTIPYRVNPHMNSPIPVEFIPDGRILLIGGTSGSARMIDTQTSETIQLLPHSGECDLQATTVCTKVSKVTSFKH